MIITAMRTMLSTIALRETAKMQPRIAAAEPAVMAASTIFLLYLADLTMAAPPLMGVMHPRTRVRVRVARGDIPRRRSSAVAAGIAGEDKGQSLLWVTDRKLGCHAFQHNAVPAAPDLISVAFC